MLKEMAALLAEKWDFFLGLLLEHLKISVLAIAIACALGLAVGVLISEHRGGSKWVLGAVNFIYTIPSISLLGFLIPFSGIGNTTAVIALTVYALLPMVRGVYTGITGIDPGVLEAARGMGSTGRQILWKVKLPLALPVVMAGVRNMATMTIALAGIASFIGAGGLGVAIYRGITTNNAAMTMAGSLLIAALAIAVDLLLGAAERLLSRRRRHGRARNIAAGAGALLVALLLIVGSLQAGTADRVIHVATKPMTEQYLMGEMLRALIEQDTELTVELTQGVGGGTANIEPAIEKGEFDLYPEYTGTGWNQVLKREGFYDESLFPEMQAAYEAELGLTWRGMYGFNNTYGLAVRRALAEEYGLETYSDLAAVADKLTFGAEYDFYEREDGYDALCAAYGMAFSKTVDLDIGLKYQAMNEGKLDAMVIFTTDGQLSTADVTVLRDDKGFYPSYLCGNVVRLDTLARHPELGGVLQRLEGVLTDADMAALNDRVETGGEEPKNVAREFLIEAGLLREEAGT